MEEIGFKQDSLRPLSAPLLAWNTVLAVVLATALVAICAHIALPLGFTPVPVTMQTFAVLLLGLLFGSGSRLCLPGALPDGRRRWSAGLQPSWSRRYGSAAWPHRRLPALLSFCRRAGQCALSPLASFFPGRTGAAAAGLASIAHSCRRRHLARAAHSFEVFCCLRPVGRTVPPRRCRQDPRRDGLRKHAWHRSARIPAIELFRADAG